MTHNRFSDSHCVYTFIQVINTKFIKVVRTKYSAFKSSNKISQEQAAPALVTEKNKPRKKRQKRKF